MATIKLSLSAKSIRSAIDEIEKYRQTLQDKLYMLVQELADIGVESAIQNVENYDAVFTSELVNSISAEERTENLNHVVFAIKTDCEHAIYVEMGTGIKGANHPYKGKLPAMYMQGKTIRQLEDGRYGWFYPDENGHWHFTEGMPSRPFMYDASLEIMDKCVEVAKRIFET